MQISSVNSNQSTSSLPLKSADINSNIGKVILSLASNFLPAESAIDFTSKKIEKLKREGLALSLKLNSQQIHRIVAELGVLSLTTQIADREKDVKSAEIMDYSQMTDEELRIKEIELQKMLNEIEGQKTWNKLLEDVSSENYLKSLRECADIFNIKNMDSETLEKINRTTVDILNKHAPAHWDNDSAALHQIVQSTIGDLNHEIKSILQDIKIKQERVIILKEMLAEYKFDLLYKADQVHQYNPPVECINEHMEEIGELFSNNNEIFHLSTSQFNEYVATCKEVLYDPNLVRRWLRKVNVSKKTDILHENPKRFVETLWNKEIGEKFLLPYQSLLDKLVEVASAFSTEETKEQSIKKIENIFNAIREQISKDELNRFKQQLLEDEKIDPAIIDDLFINKRLIPTDVWLNNTIITEVQKQEVIETAKKRMELETTLSNIKKDLDNHSLVPTQVVIENKYKKLKELLKTFPEMKPEQRYNLIVNKALLQQEIKKRRSYRESRGSRHENILLRLIGATPKEPYKTAATIQLIEDMLDSQKLGNKNVEILKNEVREAEFNGRLKAAGLSETQIKNMKLLMIKITTTIKKLSTKLYMLADEILSLDHYKNIPQNQLSLCFRKNNLVDSQVRRLISKFFRNHPDLKSLLSEETGSFESDLLNALDSYSETALLDSEKYKSEIHTKLSKYLFFYDKWQNKLAVDAIQGLQNEQEVLQQGVCMAKCLRVGHFEQTHPLEPVDKLGGETVTSMDRFEQAKYKLTRPLSIEDKWSVSNNISRKYGYDNERVWFSFSLDPNDYKSVLTDSIKSLRFENSELSKKLKLSNGVLHISLWGKDWGHAMHCRIDLARRIFRLHDPNIGIFEIPLPPEEPLSKATNELADLLRDVLETYYPDANSSALYQFVEKKNSNSSKA